MKIFILFLLYLFIASKSFSQQCNYDSIQKELIRLFSNGNHKEAYNLADYILPILKKDKFRDDSIYSYILYYASMTYGLQRDYMKPAETTTELEKITLKRFGELSMKYWSALYLRNEYFHRTGDQNGIITYNNKIKLLLTKLYAGQNEEHPGFEMVYKKRDIQFCLSVCLNSLAFAYGQIGKISVADKYIHESSLLFDEEYLVSHDPRSYTNFLFNYASYLNDIERLEEAENVYMQAVEWAKKIYNETHPSYAETLLELASFYTSTGDYEKSIRLLQQVKNIFENSFQKKNAHYRRTITSLANLYLNINNIPEAIASINLLIKLSSQFEDSDIYQKAAILFPQIRLGLINNNFQKVDSLLFEIETYEKTNPSLYNFIRPSIFNARAVFNFEKKEFKMADYYYSWLLNNEIQNGRKKTNSYSLAAMRKANNFYSWGLADSAEIYILQSTDILTELLRKNFTFFSDNQRQFYLEKSEVLFHNLNKITSTYNTSALVAAAYNSQLLLKGLLLKTSTLKNRQFAWKNDAQKNMFYEYVNLRKAIVSQSGKIPILNNNISILKEEAENLEKKLSKLTSTFWEQSINSVTLNDIAKKLKPGEAAVEYVSYYSSDTNMLGALVITYEKKQSHFVKLCSQNELDILINKKSINAEATVNLIYNGKVSNEIYKLIWHPIEIYLINTTKIYYAPSGLLYQVNMASIQSAESIMISDKYQLSQLNTTAYITNQHNYTLSASDRIILYGGITYDADSIILKKAAQQFKNTGIVSRSLPDELERSGGFPNLPGTETEVLDILKAGKSKNLLIEIRKGIQANEESIKTLDGENSPAILHIATHGFFFPNPKKSNNSELAETKRGSTLFKYSENPLFRSGLAFAGAEIAWKGNPAEGIEDGILTSFEISNMYLPNTKLVVLSACETGLGDIKGNEGVYGLQRSFNMAGVQNLIMSLWKVPDNETAEFMTLLYNNIFEGQTIENAFRNTQTYMKNKYRNEPYKWAAWILVR